MTDEVQFFVDGLPVAQPRVKATRRGNFAGVYTPKTADGWKYAVKQAVLKHFMRAEEGAFSISCLFVFPRPNGHYGSGRKADMLKPSAPRYHTQKPDRDNLEKAVMDAITATGVVWRDDSQSDVGCVRKKWVDSENPRPGCLISIVNKGI